MEDNLPKNGTKQVSQETENLCYIHKQKEPNLLKTEKPNSGSHNSRLQCFRASHINMGTLQDYSFQTSNSGCLSPFSLVQVMEVSQAAQMEHQKC